MAAINLATWSLSLKGALLTFDVTGPAWDGREVTLRQPVLVPLRKIIELAGYEPPQDEEHFLAWFRQYQAAILKAAKEEGLAWAREQAIEMARTDASLARRDELVAEIEADIARLFDQRKRLLAGEIEGAS